MRAIVVLTVLALLFILVRNGTGLDLGLTDVNPLVLGYSALFAAGLVVSELMRPVLSLMGATSRFVVVAIIAALVWFGFDQARLAGKVPEYLLSVQERADAPDAPVETRLPVAWDGVYRAVAQINNTSIGAIVDIAAPLVVLQYEEAERIGLQPQRFKFDKRVTIADRKVIAAKFALLSVRIDAVEVFEVEAAIAAPGTLEASIIGLSFLSRLSTVAIVKDSLLLRQ